jgi:hypothetical protein
MEQCPTRDTNSSLASQEIRHILWDPKVHYHVYKIPPLSTIVSQMIAAQTLSSYFFKINFNITVSYMPRKWSLSFTYHYQNPA